jgi:hypothetical protein
MQQLPLSSIPPLGRGADASGGGGHQDVYTYRWETLLSHELPSRLAADKGVNPTSDDPLAEADVVASLKRHPA